MKPLAHFLLIGGALFMLQHVVFPAVRGDTDGVIVIPAAQVDALRSAWAADTGREPGTRELAALVGRAVDEEVLVRSAREVGLHKIDLVVWRRLVENMRFTEDPAESDGDLHAAALALGMDESDLVVRRRLVDRMSQALRRLGRGTEPTDAEMRDFVARHPADFTVEPRVRFSHVFLSRQRRGAALGRDAEALREALAGGDHGAGDPPPCPAHFPFASEREIARALGTEFAAAVMRTAPGPWTGPIASAFGLHFVRVHDVRPARPASLDAVRSRVRHGVLREREEHAFRDGITALRNRYAVRVAGLDAGDAR